LASTAVKDLEEGVRALPNMSTKKIHFLTAAIIIMKTLMTADSLSSSTGGVARDAKKQGLFQTTPLVESLPLSKLCAPHRCDELFVHPSAALSFVLFD